MKRFYLVVMVLLSSLSYSQTYRELMRIVEENDFKRVMIENNFQLDNESELGLLYGLDILSVQYLIFSSVLGIGIFILSNIVFVI